jgi:hypothetical protein
MHLLRQTVLHLTKKKLDDITAQCAEGNENFHPKLGMLLEVKFFA